MTDSKLVDSRIQETLHVLAPALAAFQDPWWIIGSSALHLSGVPGIVPQDLDLLTSGRDADSLVEALPDQVDSNYLPSDKRFDSRFASFPALPMPVEVMGDLAMRIEGAWQAIIVGPSRILDVGAHEVRVPTLHEQIRLLKLFGRDKDLAKAALVSSFLKKETADVR